MSADIVKQGYVKYQSKHLGVWKKRWLILRKKSSRGESRLEKYQNEEASFNFSESLEGHHAVLELRYLREEDVSRLPETVKKHAIMIQEQTKTIQFAADSDSEMNRWYEAIIEETKSAGRALNTFNAYLMQNVKLAVHGNIKLFIAPDSVRALDVNTQRDLVSWPLHMLRRYGVERNMFTIEAGRSCPTGDGVFIFDTEDPEAVYQAVHQATQALARGGGAGGGGAGGGGRGGMGADQYRMDMSVHSGRVRDPSPPPAYDEQRSSNYGRQQTDDYSTNADYSTGNGQRNGFRSGGGSSEGGGGRGREGGGGNAGGGGGWGSRGGGGGGWGSRGGGGGAGGLVCDDDDECNSVHIPSSRSMHHNGKGGGGAMGGAMGGGSRSGGGGDNNYSRGPNNNSCGVGGGMGGGACADYCGSTQYGRSSSRSGSSDPDGNLYDEVASDTRRMKNTKKK